MVSICLIRARLCMRLRGCVSVFHVLLDRWRSQILRVHPVSLACVSRISNLCRQDSYVCCLWLKMIVYQAWRHTDFSLMFVIWTQHCKYVASFLPSTATTARTATTKRTAAAATTTTTRTTRRRRRRTTTTTTVTYLRIPPVFRCCGSTLDFKYYSPECCC